jgi:DNA helicase-2/ATP-dependent DNA helicase PcrA
MLFANARDDFAFEKVMNTPNREVRNSTKAKIRAIARQGDLSMLEAALIHFSKEPEKGDWLVQLRDISKMDFPNMLRAVYDLLHQWYDSQGLTTRAENLTRVLSFGSVWMLETPDTISVENYLSYVGGVNQQDDVTTDENTVKLMTVHASKGLEFPVVIMPACENLIFPMNNKADTPEKVEGLEEERRLFYVGMSRSMMNLIVTHARRRVFRGKDRDMEPSVFIGEAGLTEKGQVQYAP